MQYARVLIVLIKKAASTNVSSVQSVDKSGILVSEEGDVFMKGVKNSGKLRYRKKRQGSRIPWIRPIVIETEIGDKLLGHTLVLSQNGAGLRIIGDVEKGETIKIFFLIYQRWYAFSARVIYSRSPGPTDQFKHVKEVGVSFDDKNTISRLWTLGATRK